MSKLTSKVYTWRHTRTDMTNADPQAVAELMRRKATPDTRDNTGLLLGDPPPGRSALDLKRTGRTHYEIQLDGDEEQGDDSA